MIATKCIICWVHSLSFFYTRSQFIMRWCVVRMRVRVDTCTHSTWKTLSETLKFTKDYFSSLQVVAVKQGKTKLSYLRMVVTTSLIVT